MISPIQSLISRYLGDGLLVGPQQATLPKLDTNDRKCVKEITGRIPLFLKPLLQFKGDQFDEDKYLSCDELRSVTENISTFY